jgi:hypothetical protein
MLNFDTTFGSLLVVMFVFGVITGLATCATLLMARIWKDQPHEMKASRLGQPAEMPSFKQAA